MGAETTFSDSLFRRNDGLAYVKKRSTHYISPAADRRAMAMIVRVGLYPDPVTSPAALELYSSFRAGEEYGLATQASVVLTEAFVVR